jgi:hypothetical protein
LDTRALLDIQCKGLSDEQKSSATKECNSKIGHYQALDKKRLDHIREKQRMEARHFKEKSDAEVRITEEFSSIRSAQIMAENKLNDTQREAYTDEKENILATRTQLKVCTHSPLIDS